MTEIRLRRLIPFYLLATFVGPGESSDKNCQKHVAINQNTFSCCRWRWVAGWIVAINIFRTMSGCAHFIMGPSFLCWYCPSVCLSVCLSVPCLYLEGKRKGLRIPNLVGRVPGTPAPRVPVLRSRGQRSRSRRHPLVSSQHDGVSSEKTFDHTVLFGDNLF